MLTVAIDSILILKFCYAMQNVRSLNALRLRTITLKTTCLNLGCGQNSRITRYVVCLGQQVQYRAVEDYNGACCPLSKGVQTFFRTPCTEEPRIPLSKGDTILATRGTKWVYTGQMKTTFFMVSCLKVYMAKNPIKVYFESLSKDQNCIVLIHVNSPN